jgi:hypothetical protein
MVPAGMKYCPNCTAVLPLDSFGSNRSSGDGRTTYCKPCHNEIGRRNRERSGGSREYHLRRRYGIGRREVDAMILAQGGVCAACKVDPPQHVDHDHETGAVRGMLCSPCNQALGNVRDDVNRMRGLVDYLRRSRGVSGVVTVELYPQPLVPIEIDRAGFHAA